MKRDKTNSILITRAPLRYMDGTSYEKPRYPKIPHWQFFMALAFLSYFLITFLSFQGIQHAVETEYKMRFEARLNQLETEHKRLKNLLYME